MKRLVRSIGAALALFGASIFPAFAQSGPPTPPEPMYLLDVWYFQDTNWFDAYGDPPLSDTNLALVPTWDGNGLQVDSSEPAWLSYPFVSDGYPNLSLTNGTIRCWLLGNWSGTNLGGTGSGVWSRIIDAGAWTSNASYGWWSLYVDPSGCNIFFSAQSNNGLETNYLTAPIAWDGVTWHQVVLTYSESNTCLYLDGALATNGPGISILPPLEALSNGFYVLSDQTGVQQFHGQADELWIYGNQQTDTNDIANEYAQYNAIANPPLHFGDDAPSLPGGWGTNGGTGVPSGVPSGVYSPPYGSNDFWLQILPPGTNVYNTDTNSVTLILWGTIADIDYQIQMTTNIQASNVVWTAAGDVLGSEVTNFTATTVSMLGLPTVYFRALPYTLDSDGDGLPDWWEIKYSTVDFPLSPTNADTGNTGVPDGYKQDSAGDGYSNLQKYQMGIPPNVFITPPAPNNFIAILNTNGEIAFSWSAAADLPSSGAGAVTGYTLTVYDSFDGIITNITFGAGQTNYLLASQSGTQNYLASGNGYPDASLQINYANTNSAVPYQGTFNMNYPVETYIVRGPQGRLNLIAPNIPSHVQAIRVYVNESAFGTLYPKETSFMQTAQQLTGSPDYYGGYAYSFDVPVSGFTNGIYVIPYSQIPIYSWFQYTTGAVGDDGTVGPSPPDKAWAEFEYPYLYNIPFLDGRAHLQQNLAFLLRTAVEGYPFSFYVTNSSTFAWDQPPSSDYVSAGYYLDTTYQHFPGDPSFYPYLDEFQPFEDNYLYENFVVEPNNINTDGSLKTGAGYLDGENWFLWGIDITASPLRLLRFDGHWLREKVRDEI